MAEAGFWVAWGLPTQGREKQALDLLNETRGYLERLRMTAGSAATKMLNQENGGI